MGMSWPDPRTMPDMRDEEKHADYFCIDPEILPHFPELLADIWILGSWPEEIIGMIRPLELPPQSTEVLDVGCGKGAVTIPMARELRFRIRAVDFYQPFIEEARERAKAWDVENLCRFQVSDMRDVLMENTLYDIVIFAAVGGVLGDMAQSVGKLRAASRRGGYMVINDGYLTRSPK